MEVFTLASDTREILIDKMTENLPVLRKKLKLPQENPAKFIGSSRYTVMLIETKKRRMTWNTFLSLVLLFDKNEETAINSACDYFRVISNLRRLQPKTRAKPSRSSARPRLCLSKQCHNCVPWDRIVTMH